MREGRGNDDEAICAPTSEERKLRLLCRASHPASPLRTPRRITVNCQALLRCLFAFYDLRRFVSVVLIVAAHCIHPTLRFGFEMQDLPEP
jgi:hypothetical protein